MRFNRGVLAAGVAALGLASCTSAGYNDPLTAGETFQSKPVTPQARQQGQQAYSEIVKEFGDLLHAISEGLKDDRMVDHEEAARIRKEWEDLKRAGEAFVIAAERRAGV